MLIRFFLSIFWLCALSACDTGAVSDSGTVSRQASTPAIANDRELIVLTAPPAAPLIRTAEALGYRLRAVHQLADLNEVLVSFRIPDGHSIPVAIAEIEEAVPGTTAGAHHLYHLQAVGQSGGGSYANRLIGWPDGGCAARAALGMIDAAIPPDHPGFATGQIVQKSFTGDTTGTARGHGARMADLLIGPGRLRDAKLYSASVVDPALPGGDTTGVVAILKAVDWLGRQGVDVVNMSLSGPRNKLLNRGLGRAARNGMVIVAAAGNDGPDAAPRFPAAFPFVLAVTAVDADLNVYRRAVQGPHIDLAAPGVDIVVTEQTRARIFSGTSAAAPFVTAAIAADPALRGGSIEEVRRTLARSARDLGQPGADPVFGAGLLQAPEACRVN